MRSSFGILMSAALVLGVLTACHGGGGSFGVGWGTWCEFTAGPLAGQKKNFAPETGPIGGVCNEDTSTGKFVAE
jgi:hypothetical protein